MDDDIELSEQDEVRALEHGQSLEQALADKRIAKEGAE